LRIRSLRAVGWRNLAPLTLTFDLSVRLTVLHGDNGQGKTNVLEALHYLAAFRSFRTSRTVDLVQQGVTQSRIGVDVDAGDLSRTIDVRLSVGASTETSREESLSPHVGAPRPVGAPLVTRAIALDGKTVRSVASAYGVVAVVLFVPEDLMLVRAAPAARRRFVDTAVSGVEPSYFSEAAAFQKILRSRNALLRPGSGPEAATLLDTYDEQLSLAGARVVIRRRDLVRALDADVARIFRGLHADLPVAITYESDSSVSAATTELEVTAALREGFGRRRAIDRRRGHTTFGPQTDDLEIRLNGRPAREHASQGQLRSLVLAMKLAELSNVEARRGEAPVLLLDDVPSELDPTRRQYLFETLTRLSCQTVVSLADPGVLPKMDSRQDFRVASGALSSVPVFPLHDQT
jgi:DNA replication and repair protein RecF